MNTDELARMLATGAEAIDQRAPVQRCALAVGAGVIAATVLMATWLGVRSNLIQDFGSPMLWTKFAFVAWLAVGGWVAARRLARPGARLARVPGALAAPVLAMWLLAAYVLLSATAGEREALIFGGTWDACPLFVALLSAPVFAAAMWAMKGLAPTRLAMAGAAAGLLAGSVGALIYALHCSEMDAPFLAIWYLLGMLIPTAVGAVTGPWLLRW